MPDLNLWEAEAGFQPHFSKKKVNNTPWCHSMVGGAGGRLVAGSP